jgi:LPXTG-motif cell wall-anchored protein
VAPSTTPQTPPKPSSGGGSSALLLWGGLVAFLGTLAAILFNRKKKGTTP